ncbi:trehalase-like isoform X2 [Arctopsyche grandis]|uniref:trehalase-like isoform X2 n=1 Tax=Arctopsyche grandis TaxID=121162 RepID=UPI00406D8CDC
MAVCDRVWMDSQATNVNNQKDAILFPKRRKSAPLVGHNYTVLLVALPLLLAGAMLPIASAEDRSNLPPTCDSLIYCHGPLVHTIQMAGIYRDSKTFVDMKMKRPPAATLHIFELMMNKTFGTPSRSDIETFVNDNFDPEGSEFEDWVPSDWRQKPAFLNRIHDPALRQWASDLHRLWLQLGRKMRSQVRENPDLYSIIYVENPVIVPGGRFREFYYWDSFWIIKGLLLSEMKNTVRGMLSNFLSIIESNGHIPNGGRVYYKMRSQPPMLVPMMKTYMDETGDLDFLRRSMNTMEKEFRFWMTNHTINVQRDGISYRLAHYADGSKGPRPESYREDIESARFYDTMEKKEIYYAELKAAAESGWDFSTRWFILNGTNKGNLTNLMTRSIIPVDLNSLICWNAQLLSEFHSMLGNTEKANQFREIANEWVEAIDKILWHEEVGAWLDYDIHNGRRRDYFYPTNIAPLWTGSYDHGKKEYYVNRIMKYLENTKIDNYAGGLPTSVEHSGEQWDYPNAWPPLQHMVISGLRSVGVPSATRLASEWAARWIRSNYMAWKETHAMFEKYDATIAGGYGGGGEYEVQLGFGWSNSVVMDLLDMYGDTLTAVDEFDVDSIDESNSDDGTSSSAIHAASVSSVITGILALTASIAAGVLGNIPPIVHEPLLHF